MMQTAKEVLKFISIVIFIVGLMMAVNASLNRVEKARCETWDWEVCNQGPVLGGYNE